MFSVKSIQNQIFSLNHYHGFVLFKVKIPKFSSFISIISSSIEGNFGDVVGCISNDENSTHPINKLQIFNTDIMCVDFCLKHSASFAGKYYPSRSDS
jgi:hypothetical protein